MEETEWLMELINHPTREGVLRLAGSYLEVRGAYEALSGEYEEYLEDDIKETEETVLLLEKTVRTVQERKVEHRRATAALDAVRAGLALEKGTVAEVAGEITKLFAPKSKMDRRIAELIDGMLEMQAKKGRVDILTKLVTIQKIKLCARGELVEKKR